MFANKKVLMVVAHADDEVLSFGATAHRFKDVSEFHVLIMTNKCFRWQRDFATESHILESVGRVKEILGIKEYHFGRLREGFLDIDMYETSHIVEYYIDKIRPDIIFTHYGNCCHQDHRSCFRATEISTRFFGGTIFSGEVIDSTDRVLTSPFTPNIFVALREEDVVAKVNAMNCYKTELRYKRNEEGIVNYARYRGMTISSEFAESLILNRGVCLI